MKAFIVFCICYTFVFADTPFNDDDAVYDGAPSALRSRETFFDRVIIDSVGNIRAILGSQGKSIAVSGGGDAIAVIYGAPSGDPYNPMLVKIAYSINGGVSWNKYGPFTGDSRRIYSDLAYTPNFHANTGELWFAFQSCTQGYSDVSVNVMREENLPSAPSFTVPIIPPNGQAPATYPWEPSIVVMRDDPAHLVLTAWSYLANGNGWAYCWVSYDAGCGWSDTIPMLCISAGGSAGALAEGTDEYLFYTYLEYYNFSGTDSTLYPYYTESTDGGYTWSEEAPITVFPANTYSQYWWSEFDCIVVDNEPWVIHNDLGYGGTGGPHIVKGTGSPGNWTWDIWHQDSIGFDSTWVGDTLFYCWPGQYPSLSYDPVLGRVLASCKSYCYIGNTVNWAVLDGAHIQGVYSWDGGNTWRITGPLSTVNTGEIGWFDWNATETADLMENTGNMTSRNYSIWVLEDQATEAGELYFESETLGWLLDWPTSVQEAGRLSIDGMEFGIMPTIVANDGIVRFKASSATHVSLRIYDVTGRLVEDVLDGHCGEGRFIMKLPIEHLTNSTYFAVLQTEFGQQVEKFVVVR